MVTATHPPLSLRNTVAITRERGRVLCAHPQAHRHNAHNAVVIVSEHITQILESGTHTHITTRMTNEQTHKPSDTHEIQHHLPSVKAAHASRPHREPTNLRKWNTHTYHNKGD